jgi:myo-inositol-hexaphosphate 3-phosphohydrolase/PKD repeat protein
MRCRPLGVALVATLVVGVSTALAPVAHAEPVLVSELTFSPGDPTFDPHGTGTTIQGAVTVTDQGWLDFTGRAVVETPDRASLNPGTANFSFGARIALTQGVGTWTLLQKGTASTSQWKLALHDVEGGAQVSCRVSGSQGTVHVFTTGAVLQPDASWHQVACARESGTVQIRIDGQPVASGSGTIGEVTSSANYLIGSKGIDQMDVPEQFLGLLDDAFVEVDEAENEPPPPPPLSDEVTATVETAPVSHSGDAADDPAIWPHPTDPEQSLVIGNDKGGSLDVYDMQGQLVQRINEGFFGNVDVRTQVTTGDQTRDLVAVYRAGLRLYAVNPNTRQLSNVTDAGSIDVPTGGEGLYQSPATGEHYVYVISRAGAVAQYRLGDSDGDGLVDATRVRLWNLGTEGEGCVADEDRGLIYIAEEDVALWRYGAEPTDGSTAADRVAVDQVSSAGGGLAADIEGLALVDTGGGEGYLIASAQAGSDSANYYAVYDRTGANTFIRNFKVVTGELTDGCGRTDGIEALAANLGPAFPQGVFICQDNTNSAPGGSGNQNFKLVPLERVVTLTQSTNRPPSAVQSTPQCDRLTCTFDASASTDPDGDGLQYTWDFGDGNTSTAATPNHAFTAPGTYTVTVEVRDPSAATASATRTVSVTDQAAAIEYRGAGSAAANAQSVAPAVPTSARAGDLLLLVVSANRSGVSLTPPSGWQLVGSRVDDSMQTRVWRKTATASDIGAGARVRTTVTTKLVGQVMAYANTDSAAPISGFASLGQTSFTASHRTPSVAAAADAWAVSVWANKSTSTSGWSAPSSVIVRSYRANTGTGRITSLVADSGGPLNASSAGGLTAVASQAGGIATTWTIVLQPA